MAFDKSKDYLLQTSSLQIWYALKDAEGDAAFNSMSLSVFKSRARLIAHAVKAGSSRSSQDGTQSDTCVVNIWREEWLATFSADRLPMLSDKVLCAGDFWLVSAVNYYDMDDSGFHQRFRLELERAKGRSKP